jgi:pimeloyl-ACP methyl ester carboxylesterase
MSTQSIKPVKGHVPAGGLDIWVERRGEGPDVLLIAGLGDPVEAWEAQLAGLSDRYRLTAYDNRGMGRTALPDSPLTVAAMADDAAAVLRATDVPAAHVLGFSGGSVIAQELALRHPGLVRSLVLAGTWARLDAYAHALLDHWRWLMETAPGEREFLEAFFLWIYTPRAHADGMVEAFIEETLAFPHQASLRAMQRALDAYREADTLDRLGEIAVPALLLTGELDLVCRPALGRQAAEAIPGAIFEVMPGEAHQPFQEVPDVFNARVEAFWREVDAA